jgi:2-oxoglutarate/2-oxoacid ferredoxin oxidoreductase subunit alpha
MATTDVTPRESSGGVGHKRIVNDMSIQVATVNGSGSQSSNTVLLRSIFQMGVPVSGKNMFPSNIAGLPTWYTIRANKNGYIGRKKEIDFLVAMNPETAQEDTMSLAPGASVLYDEPLALHKLRDDLIFYSVPYDKLVAAVCPEAKLRKLVKNMVYVGVVANLLTIEMDEVEKAIRKQFAKKVKAANLNLAAAQAGFDYAKANLQKRGVFYIERMDKTAGKIIIDGNSAAALGCMFAGCTVVTWYPITPSSSLVETMIDYMKEYRIGPDGKATFAIVQAEDELAAIGMVIGAGWAGRAQHDGDRRPRNLADGGICRTRLLRRSSRRHLGHPARRPVHRPAHAHFAGRHSLHRVSFARRHQEHHAVSLLRRPSASPWRPRRSIWPSNSRRWCSSCPISISA